MRAATGLVVAGLICASCGQTGGSPNSSGNAAATANLAAPPNLIAEANQAVSGASGASSAGQRETVSGLFAGWELGDYLWARISVAGGEPVRAMVQGPRGDPIALFLEANRGRPVTVEITTAMMEIPEAGGQTEMSRITAARNAGGTAQAWLAGLTPAERAAIERGFEENALSGNAH